MGAEKQNTIFYYMNVRDRFKKSAYNIPMLKL